MHRIRSLCVLTLLLVPAAAFAQAESSDPSSVSGSVMRSESADLTNAREIRTRGFRQKLLQASKLEEQYVERMATFRTKRAEYRRTCREDLRRANRDAKFPMTLRCLRGELALEKEFREKELERLNALPGIPNAVRSVSVSRLELLVDAIDTVMFAIDGDVYGNQDELLEGRKNLLQKYRLPYATALTQTRLEYLLTWAQYLIISLDQTKTELGFTPTADQAAHWETARRCLTGLESDLYSLQESEEDPTINKLRTALSTAKTCTDLLSALPTETASPNTAQ